MAQTVPPRLATPINEGVLAYLRDKSAHSDIADVLLEAVQYMQMRTAGKRR